jgi:hypothetical protein
VREALKFSAGNAKLQNRGIAVFSLPAGYTCPGAAGCLSKFSRENNVIVDGPRLRYRCYAASQEAVYPSLRRATDHNLRLLREAKTTEGMADLISFSLPGFYFDKIRIHQDGDFFSLDYMRAWIKVAESMPTRLFYAYTKSLQFWMKLREEIPVNMVLTASMDGRWDKVAEKEKLRHCVVVFHPDEAEKMGIQIDHDDSYAMDAACQKFALLIHGTQPKGSLASAALKRMRQEGINYAYKKPPGV